MSSTLVAVLICDVCETTFREGLCKRVGEARVVSGAKGWRHEIVLVKAGLAPSLDFCPECQNSGKADDYIASIRKAMVKQGRVLA